MFDETETLLQLFTICTVYDGAGGVLHGIAKLNLTFCSIISKLRVKCNLNCDQPEQQNEDEMFVFILNTPTCPAQKGSSGHLFEGQTHSLEQMKLVPSLKNNQVYL